mmetsp:Transcript_5562/g.6005  ORF Transcript_5562/g.6005 Transcript_5562/m.6005 type:complete len:383 (+) Transcript_5562:32-1180(+)|eukprot:CAMPEP_0176446606 /NCGR_PEP_ID=MMETSP0127-20121128/24430_1 /TAXON_ID=938130 /ORGANISM="Platyophrya macrostoma, Strain WH" /LENGTH=382 /DNA_ID=CAMNT_0017832681 /DNA_START=32 /DNA_END=1180 /DNA_ORIENTATION=+
MNKKLCIALMLSVLCFAAFAKKTDFIPDRCPVGAEDQKCEDDQQPTDSSADYIMFGGQRSYPACVCHRDGTCEFRSDKSRCRWCKEGAASVNEGLRCPDLKGNLLHVCPRNEEPVLVVCPGPIMIDPILVDPVPIKEPVPIEEPVPEIAVCYFPVPEYPILIADPVPIEEPVLVDPVPVYPVDPVPVDPVVTNPIRFKPLPVGEPVPLEPTEPVSTTPIKAVLKPQLDILVASPIEAAKQEISTAKPDMMTIMPVRPTMPLPIEPVLKVKKTNGCVCTSDGVCKKQKLTGWKSACEDENVVAVIEEGACPKSAPCKMKAPADATKCTRESRNIRRMCPMYISFNGCVCFKDGTCQTQGTNACSACQNPDVVSFSTSSDCNCI